MTFTKAQRERALKINYKIRMAGSSQTAIAKLNKKTQQAVWNVIWGLSESRPIKRTIARITGERIEDLWPENDGEDRRAA